jgi:hypothetical protein
MARFLVNSDCLRGFATWFCDGLRRCPLARASHLRRGVGENLSIMIDKSGEIEYFINRN